MLHACTAANNQTIPLVHLAPECREDRLYLTIVGDSLARGWGASAPQKSFAALVFRDVRDARPHTTMRNLGIPGATSDEIASKEIPFIPSARCSLIIVVAGANDVQRLYTPRHFYASYVNLLAKIRARDPRAALIVMGLPDVSLSPRIPWPLKPIESWLSRAANRSIAVAAKEHGAAFVPLYAVSHDNAYRSKTLLSGDGLRPNDAGYRIMAGAASPAITTLLEPARRF